jgi:hypothetical protein
LWLSLLDLEDRPLCDFDWLAVWHSDGDAAFPNDIRVADDPLSGGVGTTFKLSNNLRLAVRLCSQVTSSLPGPLTLGSAAYLQFYSDSAAVASGFVAMVEAVQPATCAAANVVATSSGTFGVYTTTASVAGSAIPQELVPAYGRGLQCGWLVQVLRRGACHLAVLHEPVRRTHTT